MASNKSKKLDEAVKNLNTQVKGGTPGDDISLAHEVVISDDEKKDVGLEDPKKTSPAIRDEQAFGGDAAALTSDDDIDEVGKDYGVRYKDEEELDIAKKIDIQTQPGPPEIEEEE